MNKIINLIKRTSFYKTYHQNRLKKQKELYEKLERKDELIARREAKIT